MMVSVGYEGTIVNGGELLMTCTVTIVEGLTYKPTVTWSGKASNNITTSGDMRVAVETSHPSDLETVVSIHYDPYLSSSDGDKFLCHASLKSLAPPYHLDMYQELQIITERE